MYLKINLLYCLTRKFCQNCASDKLTTIIKYNFNYQLNYQWDDKQI